MLGEKKARDQGNEHGDADEQRVRHIQRAPSTRSGEEQRNAGEDEHEL